MNVCVCIYIYIHTHTYMCLVKYFLKLKHIIIELDTGGKVKCNQKFKEENAVA